MKSVLHLRGFPDKILAAVATATEVCGSFWTANVPSTVLAQSCASLQLRAPNWGCYGGRRKEGGSKWAWGGFHYMEKERG